MCDTTVGLDQIEDDVFICEVSDEALETAAGREKVENFTLAFCSGIATCPA